MATFETDGTWCTVDLTALDLKEVRLVFSGTEVQAVIVNKDAIINNFFNGVLQCNS